SLVLAHASFDAQWKQVSKSESAFIDLLEAIPMLPDQDLRAKAFDQTKALLDSGGATGAASGNSEVIKAAAIHALVSMHRDYEKIFQLLTALVQRKQAVQAAAQGILTIPRSQWSRSQAAPAASAFVQWAKAVPADRRTTPEYSQIIQVAGDLAGLAPADQAAVLRRQLKELRVSVFLVRSVREQMRFDTTRLVVEAGKPFEIIFENPDFMP